MNTEPQFPIMCRNFKHAPSSIPWSWIAPFENAAQHNHGQSLAQLAERGGLDPTEVLAVVENRRWRTMECNEAAQQFLAWIAAHKETETQAKLARALHALKAMHSAFHAGGGSHVLVSRYEALELAKNAINSIEGRV